MFTLASKTAVVTGAASGIGEAIARLFAAVGAQIIVADVDATNGERVAKLCGAAGRYLHLDVADAVECMHVAERLRKEVGIVDIVVNNAGIGHVGTIEETSCSDLDQLYAVNVRGVFNVSKAFISTMIERHAGVIINVASVGGIVGIRDRLAYCTTKFAVVGFTKSMALDHASDGVRINCVCPGRVETPFVTARLREYSDPNIALRQMTATQPIGRMATSEEIAAAVLYLASDEAAFVTGTALLIDGGWSAG